MLLLNGQPLSVTMFPDKTSQVWKLPEEVFSFREVLVEWQFESESELFHLIQLKNLLDSREIISDLSMPYLPYGRQDKDIANNATFALLSFSKILNSLTFRSVRCIDPHSKIAGELIDNFVASYPVHELKGISKLLKSDIVCYPDKGALEKYSKIYKFNFIYGEKIRDQLTGNITNYEVIGECTGKSVLIVDDICDGGMTFKILTKDLLAKGATEVNLFVTHGIFSRGLQTLKDSGINRIFTHEGEEGLAYEKNL